MKEMRHVSQSVFDILGAEARDVDGIGMDFFVEFINEDDQGEACEIYQRAIDVRSRFTMEYRIKRPSGEILGIREVCSFQDGSNGLSVGTMLDIPAINQSERELKQNAWFLATAQRIARMGAYIFDNDAERMIFVSPELAQIHGVPEAGLLGTLDHSLNQLDPRDLDRVLALHREYIVNSTPHGMAYHLICPDGERRIVREVGEAVAANEGGSRMIGTVIDLTDI